MRRARAPSAQGPKIAFSGGLEFNDHHMIRNCLDEAHAKHARHSCHKRHQRSSLCST
ncbi:SLOG family protein [Hyphomicrobium sp.]|uniref:SLOG family protein n=1 Tax=Hyphomicrobium sp. TaxID=82 RepID=UPI003FA614A4